MKGGCGCGAGGCFCCWRAGEHWSHALGVHACLLLQCSGAVTVRAVQVMHAHWGHCAAGWLGHAGTPPLRPCAAPAATTSRRWGSVLRNPFLPSSRSHQVGLCCGFVVAHVAFKRPCAAAPKAVRGTHRADYLLPSFPRFHMLQRARCWSRRSCPTLSQRSRLRRQFSKSGSCTGCERLSSPPPASR